jgi:hypothetical protein
MTDGQVLLLGTVRAVCVVVISFAKHWEHIVRIFSPKVHVPRTTTSFAASVRLLSPKDTTQFAS